MQCNSVRNEQSLVATTTTTNYSRSNRSISRYKSFLGFRVFALLVMRLVLSFRGQFDGCRAYGCCVEYRF